VVTIDALFNQDYQECHGRQSALIPNESDPMGRQQLAASFGPNCAQNCPDAGYTSWRIWTALPSRYGSLAPANGDLAHDTGIAPEWSDFV
jgi:hypothetical protein